MIDQFEQHDLLIESRQYRTPTGRKALNLRTVADFAFVDLITLFILGQEYEMAPVSTNYAAKTLAYTNFNKTRLSGTDLYTSLNILFDPEGYFSKNIAQNEANDALLRAKLRLHLPTFKRYLELIESNSMSPADAAQLMLRIEKQLGINDTILKSIRRLAQDYPALNLGQRKLLITKLLQFYKRRAKRSELGVFLDDMGRSKNYVIRGAIDSDLSNLGYQSAFGAAAKAAIPLVGMVAGIKAGQALGKKF
jgi:hypothetical protein